MDSKCNGDVRRRGISAWVFGVVTAMMVGFAVAAGAQAQTASGPGSTAEKAETRSYETLYLNSSTPRMDAYDIVTDLRNMLPRAKLYFVAPQNAISIYGTADEIALAKQVLAGVDRPRKSYRLTYTLTETGGGQAAETRHVVLRVVAGGTAEMKQGTRVPIVTGTTDPGGKTQNEQVQYLDVGLRIEAKLDGTQDHLRLHTVVSQSEVAEGHSGVGTSDPVIRQTSLDGASTLAGGKAVALGSLDIPVNGQGGERHITIEVTAEPAG